MLIWLTVSSISATHAQSYLEIGEAVKQRLLNVLVSGAGGYSGKSIAIEVRNTSGKTLYISIEPGRIFENGDSSYQNLILMEEVRWVLAPNERKKAQLSGMCTESHDACPQKGQAFSLGAIAAGALKELAALTAAKKYQNSTVQCAVWAIANNDPIENIYGEDTSMMHQVANIVSKAVGKPVKSFNLTPKVHRITNISTSADVLIPTNIQDASLAVYDSAGNRVRTYFEHKTLERGFRQFRFAMNHTQGDRYKLYVRLKNGSQTLYERELRVTDSIASLQTLQTSATFNYEVKQTINNTTLGIFDEAGNCYFVVEANKPLTAGYQRGTYSAKYDVPKGKKYFLQIRDAANAVVQSHEITANDAAAKTYPKARINGTYAFKIESPLTDAMLAIYNANGERIRVIYDHSNFNPGNKQVSYWFDHFQGPEMKFYIRLTDAEGKTVSESCVNCPK